MNNAFKKLLIGASITASMSAIASAPAFASGITNVTVTGNDYIKYDAKDGKTFKKDDASLEQILTGDASNPTGNIELFASSEQSSLSPSSSADTLQRLQALGNFLNYNQVTSLKGEIGGKQITISSLTAEDWFGASTLTSVKKALAQAPNNTQRSLAISQLYNSTNLASTWFNNTLSRYGATPNQTLFNTFLLAGGFQRFSDPNISYVNQDNNGLIRIGLAGHYDAAPLLGINSATPLQASELVKVAYNNGSASVFYSYNATRSGLTETSDGRSHDGNYEVTLQGAAPKSTPEPGVIFGLLAIGGVFKVQRQMKKTKAQKV